jgi:hypothetical protein
MKSIPFNPAPHIPACKIRGRLISAYDFLPRLKKLCLSLGFNDPVIRKLGKLPPPSEMSVNKDILCSRSLPNKRSNGRDRIIILSTKISYEQNWGGYSGLPNQHFQERSETEMYETLSDYILPYLKQYQFAQTKIHLGCDKADKFVATLPDHMVWGKESNDGISLRILIEKIAEPNAEGQFVPLDVSGPLVTFSLAPKFHQDISEEKFPWKVGVFKSIGEHLRAELFHFVNSSEKVHDSNPYSAMLLPLMPWVVTHKTPHLAATLVHLQTNFLSVSETFTATGPDDLRNLLCVTGLDIDMRGFRGRTERYFVPWQACWKRHGYCYGNIYPLQQDDLLVALKNFNKGSGDEN